MPLLSICEFDDGKLFHDTDVLRLAHLDANGRTFGVALGIVNHL
jgi:hypothetical protein